MEKIYVYDGSFYGFLTAVFYVYFNHDSLEDICTDSDLQLAIGAETLTVETEEDKAERVMASIVKKIGKLGFYRIYKAFLSDCTGREKLIFDYIGIVLRSGRDAKYLYAEKTVTDVLKLSEKTGSEAHLLRGFLRFRETEAGIYYAEFSPKTDCISLIAPHFKNRLSGLNFAINDLKRKKAAIWDKEKLEIINYESFFKPEETENEKAFCAMWKSFYKTVSIAERKNEKCRMTHVPKRFWRYMCEMEEF